ncbi:MAG: FHA domain-containing protein [Bdellovibrionota bacterium]
MPADPNVLHFHADLPPSRQVGERLRLLVIEGPDKGSGYCVRGDLLFLGRDDCQISLTDLSLSRNHAELSWKGDHYALIDLASANGVFHNGQKVREAKLCAGDVLRFGDTVIEAHPPGPTQEEPAGAQPKLLRGRLLVAALLLFLGTAAYLLENKQTFHEHTRLAPLEEEQLSRVPKISPAALRASDERINRLSRLLSEELARRAALEERLKIEKLALSPARVAASAPSSDAELRKREEADVYFRTGVRELENKNYSRAFTAFNTATLLDSSYDLAKIYLAQAKAAQLTELRYLHLAGIRAKDALRYRDARVNFVNIIQLLGDDQSFAYSFGVDSDKDLRGLLEDARKELAEINLAEGKRQH